MSLSSVVIVGAGQAGYQTAASLRQEGYEGAITLIGDEPGVPYQRPPLSKAYLLGKITAPTLNFRPHTFYEEKHITRLQDRVTTIDRGSRLVELASGGTVAYDHLVLAVGARNRELSVPGADLDGVFGLRTLADADALSPRVRAVRDVVVIGAGFIGLEFAAVAAALGTKVHVLELGPRPMARAISPRMSEVFASAHAAWGVTLSFNQGVARVLGADGKVTGVETPDGTVLPAELVVYGIGVVPNVQLAGEAGLEVENGVRVDSELLTSDPAISAIGDGASFPSLHSGAHVRLESVQNAVDQARHVAARLMGKSPGAYAALPWFWTDQGELKLQIAGLADGCDETLVVGSPDTRQMSVLCFRQGRLIAVESVNRPVDHMSARKILARASGLTPAQAAEAGFDLKAYELATREAG
jgi:3-phenylpropionate/trans-cinnamate dioxygenase ferredoxin reductase subunit